MTFKRRLILLAMSGLFTLFLAEVCLGIAAWAIPSVGGFLSRTPLKRGVRHETLGVFPNPEFIEHDELGFRNPSVPEKAWVVALGDSQTYGTGVSREDAWPQVLGKSAKAPVYSMGFGGWCPVHSVMLWEQVVARRPSVIVQALYAGNDCFDAFQMVRVKKQCQDLWPLEPHVAGSLLALEEKSPLEAAARNAAETGSPVSVSPPKPRDGVRETLAEHSRVFGFIRGVKRLVTHNDRYGGKTWVEAKAIAAKTVGTNLLFHPDPLRRTILTPVYRRVALNRVDPRVADGAHLNWSAIKRLADLAKKEGIRFVVLLIPTKEYVYRELVEKKPPDDHQGLQAYLALMDEEEAFWRDTEAFLSSAGIPWVDPVPGLRRSLVEGSVPYRQSLDGHPAPGGHKVLAEQVRDFLAFLENDREILDH